MNEQSVASPECVANICSDLHDPMMCLVKKVEQLFLTLVDAGLDEEANTAAEVLEKATTANALILALEKMTGGETLKPNVIQDSAGPGRLVGFIDEGIGLMQELEIMEVAS